MTEKRPHHITAAHYAAFGMIINTFAEIDTLLDGIIASMIGGDEEIAGILLNFVDNRDKRDFISAVIGATSFPKVVIKEADKLMERVGNAATLRNSIAHDTWVSGFEPNTVKPLGAKARGKLKVFGTKPGEREWTPQDLVAEAEKNQAIGKDLLAFMAAHGLDPRHTYKKSRK